VVLSGLHFLLTYQCNLECDHCFVWGGPHQTGTMTFAIVRKILGQAKRLGTIDWVFYEGGEPFLYYPMLVRSVRLAARMGFRVGIVSNGYWATDLEDAIECLKPFAGRVQDLSISSDRYHWSADLSRLAENACAAAAHLGIPVGVIRIAQPEATNVQASRGQLPVGESKVMFRGRAAVSLVDRVGRRPWTEFTTCPHENLRDPGRVHVDPLGILHLCQGISMGNVLESRLADIIDAYHPDSDPIVGPILAGGPAELVRRYDLPHEDAYADACHLCYEARRTLRARFPEILTPDQMYGVTEE